MTDEHKFLFVLSFYSQGHAAPWAESMYTKHTETISDWTTFKSMFLTHFYSHNTEGEAQLQLANMRQGSGNILAFSSKFTIVAYHTSLDDDADIQYYM